MKDFFQEATALVAQMTLDEKINMLQHEAPAIPRLGIKAFNWWSESPHGVGRCGVATVFPQSIAMAASFNTELMEQVGDCVSDEVRAKYNEYIKQGFTDIYQGLSVCGPVLNIVRDPRWGRVPETYGEDPYLTGRMGTAYVKGMQGSGKYWKTANTLEHFAVHSGPENGRLEWDVDVTERDLFETYVSAFGYCIKHGKPAGVMPAYNRFRGVPCCMNKYLMTDVLRHKLGFEGFTMTDAGEVEMNFGMQTLAKTHAEMAALCVKAGSDLSITDKNLTGDGRVYDALREAVTRGLITEEEIDAALTRVMQVRCKLGMHAEDCKFDQISYDVVDCEKHRKLNRKMAQESIVLLKNDGILPLKKDTKVAVIGPCSDDKLIVLGNYYGYPSHHSTFLSGIQKICEKTVEFSRGVTPSDAYGEKANDTPAYEAVIAAKRADVVIFFMGNNPYDESEECDYDGDRKTIDLPENQQAVYEMVKALGKKMIFVSVGGSVINLSRQDSECNAVLQCYYPGAEGGDAMADILFGNASPSGRLPLTVYAKDADLPPITDYSMENRTYKFFKGTPLYPFGYGLTYSDIHENWLDENTVELTNRGPFDSDYAVLKFEYIPHKNLCGFEKVFLKNGETKTVTFRDDR